MPRRCTLGAGCLVTLSGHGLADTNQAAIVAIVPGAPDCTAELAAWAGLASNPQRVLAGPSRRLGVTAECTLGAGCLALPHSLKQMGTVPALALCALTAWASHLSIVLLAECLHACSVRTYEELAVLAFGKNASRVISGSIFLIVFGSAVAYTIAVGVCSTSCCLNISSVVLSWWT